MTIASEIEDLQTNLSAAKSAVTTKGGTVGNTGLAGLASEIATIPSGGGVDPTFFGCDEGVAEMNYLENIMPEILTINYGGLATWL